ncbi:small membrane protein [Raoultella ornithinolytica]|nr:small membrane protein [Raoultella ornithinolytica]KAB8155600.1 small membrane protein [Raoultella ornithinolytica]KAB8169443.1 small membrane protein [Raoultella ornithinolytica]MEB7899437.1 small membrane protein [Raoultella ornithinolytica]QWU11842.1 small membrane protein [Raoultella ornithinolytica]WLP48017.1 small membrane protein [Raoultella ornithinolytica]
MALQTWLALLLCLFSLAVSVYSFISYIKDRRKERFPFASRKMRRK